MNERDALIMLRNAGYSSAYKLGSERLLSLSEAIDDVGDQGVRVQVDFRQGQVWLWEDNHPGHAPSPLPLWCVTKVMIGGAERSFCCPTLSLYI